MSSDALLDAWLVSLRLGTRRWIEKCLTNATYEAFLSRMTRTGLRQHTPTRSILMRSVITSATPMAVVRRSRLSRVSLLGVALAFTTLAACSGKSSGGAPSSVGSLTPPSPSGDTAVKAVVVSGYQAFQGGLSYPLLQVEATLPASSPLKPAVVAVVDRMVGRESSPATRVKAAMRTSVTTPAPTYDSTLGLYEAGFTISGATLTDQFYSDAAGTQSAGTLTVPYPAGTTITSLGKASAPPPYTMTITANITAGNLPM